MSRLTTSLRDRRVVVVVGAGGVGKTTSAAALAIALALDGRSVCVLTVDPARRLASALGLSLDEGAHEVAGPWTGRLTAVQLDAGRTFDGLLDRYGGTPDAVAAVRRNPIYRSLAGALGGTQEYMAVERLYELSSSGHFDVVVIDTPPTRNAVDLLDAPQRLLSFLTHPIVRALLVPTRVSLRAASLGAAAAMRTIGAVVGTDLIGDVMGFFQAFSSLHEGFIERARAVHDLLQHEGTAFVLTTTPRADSLEEASWFTDQLSRRSLEVSAVVINRVHLSFTEHDPERLPIAVGSLGAQLDNLRHLERLARHDRAVLSTTASWAPTSVEIPRLADPPTDIAALVAIASHYM